MAERKPRAWWPVAVLVAVAVVTFVGQLFIGRSILGPIGLFGLIALLAPAAIAVEALAGDRHTWPERLLATLAGTTVVTLVGGLLVLLSPRGYSAPTLAVIELGMLAIATAVWLHHRWRSPQLAPRVHAVPRARPPMNVNRLSIAIVVVALGLGAAGFAIATWAAQTQDYGGYVQFWSVAAGSGATVGVQNGITGPITCDVTLDRPGQGTLVTHVTTLQPGEQWVRALPNAQAGETEPWQLALSCTHPGGEPIVRTLSISPPA